MITAFESTNEQLLKIAAAIEELSAEKRRSTHTAPMLLQTYIRDTGEILNDLSMPIMVDGRHWGAIIIGLNPEVFLK